MNMKTKIEIQNLLHLIYENVCAANPNIADYTEHQFVENLLAPPHNTILTDTIFRFLDLLDNNTDIHISIFDNQEDGDIITRLTYYEGNHIQTRIDLPALYFPVAIKATDDIMCVGLKSMGPIVAVYALELSANQISTKEKMLELYGSRPHIFGMMPPKMTSDVCDIFKKIGGFIDG